MKKRNQLSIALILLSIVLILIILQLYVAKSKSEKLILLGSGTQLIVKESNLPFSLSGSDKQLVSESELRPWLIEQRNFLLAKADSEIRSGIVRLAEAYPQLKKASTWRTVETTKSEAGSISIGLSYSNIKKGGITGVPAKDSCSILVLIRNPPSEVGQLAEFPIYPNLDLSGQVGSSAGDPKLNTALKNLIVESLVQLKQLEDGEEKANLYYQKQKIGLAVELTLVGETNKFQLSQSIFLEARLRNDSNEVQIYSQGFGITQAKHLCQIELITSDGKAWAAEAVPFVEFYNYKDIVLQPKTSIAIGKWDISHLEYNLGHTYRTMGDIGRTSFQSFAKPGKYFIRWWDGVFQGERPLVSPKLEFELVSVER
jgi:hypothetical protein